MHDTLTLVATTFVSAMFSFLFGWFVCLVTDGPEKQALAMLEKWIRLEEIQVKGYLLHEQTGARKLLQRLRDRAHSVRLTLEGK